MNPRRLPHASHPLDFHRTLPGRTHAAAAGVGWTRKAMAIAMHLSCLALFGLIVVWPVASPIASGQLAREFKPVLQALAAASPWKRAPQRR